MKSKIEHQLAHVFETFLFSFLATFAALSKQLVGVTDWHTGKAVVLSVMIASAAAGAKAIRPAVAALVVKAATAIATRAKTVHVLAEVEHLAAPLHLSHSNEKLVADIAGAVGKEIARALAVQPATPTAVPAEQPAAVPAA